ncbi:MAG: MFS transporter [Halobacteriaceae archaeon]
MNTRGRGGVFLAVCLFAFLVNFGRVAFAALVDPFMAAFHVEEATAGLVATAVWLGSALPRLPTGYLLTRVRRHHAIVGMAVFLVGAATFTALAPDVTVVTVGALLIGVSSGVFYIAASPLVSELYPEKVGWAVGIRGTAAQLAAVGAPVLVGGALLLGSWRYTFWGLALATLVGLVLFARAVGAAEMPSAGVEDRDLVLAARRQWRIILAGIAVISVLGFTWQGIFNFYVSYLAAAKGITPATGRTLLTLVFAAGVPAFALSGRMADAVTYLPLLFGCLAGFVLTLVALLVAEGVLAVAVVSVAMGFAVHSVFPVTDTYLLATLPDEHRGSAYAVYSATMMLLQAPGSVVLGALVEAGATYTDVFAVYAVVLAGVLATLVVLYRADRLPKGTPSGTRGS